MYSSERSPTPVSICGCVNLLVRTVPVPPNLTVVAPVVDAPVSPHPSVTVVRATPFPPKPMVDFSGRCYSPYPHPGSQHLAVYAVLPLLYSAGRSPMSSSLDPRTEASVSERAVL